jgi:hypothetical protein
MEAPTKQGMRFGIVARQFEALVPAGMPAEQVRARLLGLQYIG